jgi:hypothetical protein
VSVGLSKLGDVLVAAGDLAGARNHFEESLKLRRALSRQNPSAASATRDVSVSLVKLGAATKEISHLREARDLLRSLKRAGVLLPSDEHVLQDLEQLDE